MSAVDFKPSQVRIDVPPFVGTFEHAEAEGFAALMVLACKHKGDDWQQLAPHDIDVAIAAAVVANEEPWPSLNRNPFFVPSVHALVKIGAAEFVESGASCSPIRFTEAGLKKLRRWLKPSTG